MRGKTGKNVVGNVTVAVKTTARLAPDNRDAAVEVGTRKVGGEIKVEEFGL